MRVLSDIIQPAKLENLDALIQSVLNSSLQVGLSDKMLPRIQLAVEEAIVNICSYAYPEGPGDVEVICRDDADFLIIEIINSGVPFDMTTLQDPDVTLGLEERSVGGLGVLFMKKMMDDIRYSREDNKNILDLYIRKSGP